MISAKTRLIHVLYPGTTLLDVAGPQQVFRDAGKFAPNGGYDVRLVSVDGGSVVTKEGFTFDTESFARVRLRSSDLVLVPGGSGVFEATRDDRLVGWLKRRAPRAGLVASTCTGAFLLAEAGLLDGRRAVTHWDDCARLREEYPDVLVEEDPIFIADGPIRTSAGVTAGIDLALALVEDDHGRQVALDLARSLVIPSKRQGGQSQFSAHLQRQVHDAEAAFETLHLWVTNNLAADLRVERLADRMGMSPRSFYRTYRSQAGVTPARMVSRMRVDGARRLLEETDQTVKSIARACGFGTEEQMRCAFQRELKISPSAYRAKWS